MTAVDPEVEALAIRMVGERRWSVIGFDAKERARERARIIVSDKQRNALTDPTPPSPAPKKKKSALGLWLHHQRVVMAGVPTKYVVLLSLLLGVVTVLNQTTFGFSTPIKTTITDVLALGAFLGIGPWIGPKFQTALHLAPALATAIGVVLMIGMLVVQQDVHMPLRAIIIGIIQVAGGLGFAPRYVPMLAI